MTQSERNLWRMAELAVKNNAAASAEKAKGDFFKMGRFFDKSHSVDK